MVLNTGTNYKLARPSTNTRFLSKLLVVKLILSSFIVSACFKLPFILQLIKAAGMIILIKLGKSVWIIIEVAVICPPIHNMVVVTSPIGDQAPPELAAITTRAANISRSSLSAIIFRNSETRTMVVVRLSRTADKKNVMNPISQTSFFLFVVFIRLVIM